MATWLENMVLKTELVNESVWHPFPSFDRFIGLNQWSIPSWTGRTGRSYLIFKTECWWGHHPLHFGGARVFCLLGLTRERNRTTEIIISNWRWQSRARVVVENGNINGWRRTTWLMAKWDDDVDYWVGEHG